MANNFANAIDSNIGASNSGATNTLTVTNPSNTASSQALVNVTVGGSTAGDAFTTYTVAGVTNWSEGVDNSDADSYVVAASTALGTTNVIHAVVAGSINYPLQPAFLAFLGTSDTNATGAGTTYTLGAGNALTEVFDQQNNFVTSGTFTAPVTGRYYLAGGFIYAAVTAAMTFVQCDFNTSNAFYTFGVINIGAAQTIAAAPNVMYNNGSVFADMDAADTFVLTTAISGGVGNTVTISANVRRVFICGYLVC